MRDNPDNNRTSRIDPDEFHGERLTMTEDHHFRVASRCELLPYLISLPLGLSRKKAKELLRFQAVAVRHKGRLRHDTQLDAGDIVAIAVGKPAPDATLRRHSLKIVHLDDTIVVIEKPEALLAMGSEREKERTAHRLLNEYLKAVKKSRLQQAFIVHRLDRETSGLMIFARDETTQAALQQNWKSVLKRYLAIVEGALPNAQGTLKDHLVESRSLRVHRVDKGGNLAITHYRVLEHYGDRSLLELTLESGRKNQIRVQLAARDHPIVGDLKYGARTDPARRLALHASELKFRHPVSRASMEFCSPLPARLKALLDRPEPRAD